MKRCSGWSAALTATSLLLVGCVSWGPQEPSLGGWALGAQMPCIDVVLVALATEADLKDPEVGVTCYAEGAYLRDGRPLILNRGVGIIIAVVRSRDGSRRAVGLSCLDSCARASPPLGLPAGYP